MLRYWGKRAESRESAMINGVDYGNRDQGLSDLFHDLPTAYELCRSEKPPAAAVAAAATSAAPAAPSTAASATAPT